MIDALAGRCRCCLVAVNDADNFLQIVILLSLVGLLSITNTQTGTNTLTWNLKDSLTVLVILSVAVVAFWTKLSKYIEAAQIKMKGFIVVLPDAMLDAYGNIIGDEKEPDPHGLGPGTANPTWTEKMVTIETTEVVCKNTPYYIRRDHLDRIVEKTWKHPCPPPPDSSDAPEQAPEEEELCVDMDIEHAEQEEQEDIINPLARAIDTDPWRRLSQVVDDPVSERATERAKEKRVQNLAARSLKLHNDIPRQSLPEILVIARLEGMEPGQLLKSMKDNGNVKGKDAASLIVQRIEETHKADEDLRDELYKLEVKPLQRWISKRNFTLLEYQIMDAVESDTPKASVIELVISVMTLRRLSKLARQIGCADDKVEDAIDRSHTPCTELIRLMKEQQLSYSIAKRIEFARQLPRQRGLEIAIGVNDIRFEFEGAGLHGRLHEYAWLKARALAEGVPEESIPPEPRPAKAYLEEIEAQDHEHLTQEAMLETVLGLIELGMLSSTFNEALTEFYNQDAKVKADERAAKVRLKMAPVVPARPETAVTSARQVS